MNLITRHVLLLSLLGVLLTGCISQSKLSEAEFDANIARGDIIVQAIQQYEQEQGQLPTTIQELVPTYLATIPPPPLAQRLRMNVVSRIST